MNVKLKNKTMEIKIKVCNLMQKILNAKLTRKPKIYIQKLQQKLSKLLK